MVSATLTDCSTRMIVVPSSASSPHHGQQLFDDDRRQAERQLVDHEQSGSRDQGHAEREHLLLAAGQVRRRLAASAVEHREQLVARASIRLGTGIGVASVEPAGHVRGSPATVSDGNTPCATRHLDDASAGDLVRGRERHVAPVEDDRTAVGLDDAGDRT